MEAAKQQTSVQDYIKVNRAIFVTVRKSFLVFVVTKIGYFASDEDCPTMILATKLNVFKETLQVAQFSL